MTDYTKLAELEPLMSTEGKRIVLALVAERDALQARLDSTESDYKGKCAELELVHDSHDAALAKLKELEDQKDGAYLERNRLVSLLSKVFPSGKKKTAIEGWSEDWHGCVYIDLPTGQASWHYHDSQAWLFDHLPEYQGTWDGHTTEEKYERIAAYANPISRTLSDVPTMFWNWHDAEKPHGSIDELLNDEICNGTPLEVGAELTIQRAISLPKIKIRITSIDEEACEAEYEIVEAALKGTP